MNGSANQALPHRFRARAQVDYFSNIITNQTFNTNVLNASSNRRYFSTNVTGIAKGLSVNGTFDRTEYFNNTTSSHVIGSSPRITLSLTVSGGEDFCAVFREEFGVD